MEVQSDSSISKQLNFAETFLNEETSSTYQNIQLYLSNFTMLNLQPSIKKS